MVLIDCDFERKISDWFKEKYEIDPRAHYEIELAIADKYEIAAIQYYVLMCQKYDMYDVDLRIQCDTDVQYRILHYIYFIYESFNIYINDIRVLREKSNTVRRRIFPLVPINNNIYSFFSGIVSDYIVFENEELRIKDKINNSIAKKILVLTIEYLVGVIKGNKNLENARVKYFNTEGFFSKIEKMPVLAFVLFAYYNREKCFDLAEAKKEQIKEKSGRKAYSIQESDIPEAFPNDDGIDAELFNAWDISDGLLQLVENVVQYAPSVNVHKEVESQKAVNEYSGKGVLSLRIYGNAIEEEKAFLNTSYSGYFEGLENVHKRFGDRVCTESEFCELPYNIEDIDELKKRLEIKRNIESRHSERCKRSHYLNVQIADASGRCMTDVFLDNLKTRNCNESIQALIPELQQITVRSMFDPNQTERLAFNKYYVKSNLVYHYGLQIFSSVILNNDGFFGVQSCSDTKNSGYDTANGTTSSHSPIQGTRYDILIPFVPSSPKANTMINSNIQYNESSNIKYHIVDSTTEWVNRILEATNQKQVIKNAAIEEIADLFDEKVNDIVLFDVSKIDYSRLEVFCKSLILHIINKDLKEQEGSRLNFALVNCELFDFINIIRTFCVCFDRDGNGEWMKDSQVYLCGTDTAEEFLISGPNLGIMMQRVEKLAFSRKVHPYCEKLLKQMMEKRNYGSTSTDEIYDFIYTPFDLYVKQNGETVFEKNVEMILNKNMQNFESGCLIKPLHTRLGSKIHIDRFYEAELLFYNNYYTDRFALLMVNRFVDQFSSKVKDKRVCFLGYETYSEMLLSEITKYYDMQGARDSLYAIYESADNKIRYEDRIKKSDCIVIVVPISTTLTTFNKIKSISALKGKSIILCMAVIQVRGCKTEDNLENKFWCIDTTDRTIRSERLLGNELVAWYQVCVEAHWQDPLACRYCFPKDLLFERPLIETDRTSVVPTQLVGLFPNDTSTKSSDGIDQANEYEDRIESLKNYVYYGHITRNNNHFKYYVRTAAYVQDKMNHADVIHWLNDIQLKVNDHKDKDRVYYDILVSPFHFSSTYFVELVNERVFQGASYVIRLDPNKEYRDNVRTKYSDLIVLVENLINSNTKAALNFHYVDDNIISGVHFHRVKHLIEALFIEKQSENVEINVFDSIIVLLNRLSYSSINSYIENSRFFSYLNLNISSLRNHKDACYLCRRYEDAKDMSSKASQNSIVEYWDEQIDEYRPLSLKEAKEYNKAKLSEIKKEQKYIRLCYAHKINSKLDRMKLQKNDSHKVFPTLLDTYFEVSPKDNDFLPDFIRTISTPFISDRKSVRESSLLIVLILMEVVFKDCKIENIRERGKDYFEVISKTKKQDDYDKWVYDMLTAPSIERLLESVSESFNSEEIKKSKKRKDNYIRLAEELIIASVNLKSNYLIRKPENLKKVVRFFCVKNKHYQTKSMTLITAQVKKLVSLSSDEAKSVYLDKWIITELESKKEEFPSEKEKEFYKAYRELVLSIYMENTRTIMDAVFDLENKQDDDRELALKNLDNEYNEYYLDNYVKTLVSNHYGEETTGEMRCSDITRKVLDFYIAMNSKFNDTDDSELMINNKKRYINFYNQLSEKIKSIVDARKVSFAIPSERSELERDKDGFVKPNACPDPKYEIFASTKLDDDQQTLDILKGAKSYVNDSYHISKNQQNCIILINSLAVNNARTGYMKPIWIIIEFNDQISPFCMYRGMRWILMFRKSLLKLVQMDFKNNLFQKWLADKETINELKKSRSIFHSTADKFYVQNEWNTCKKLIFDNEVLTKDSNEINKDGLILDLMIDIRIGRINSMLLSGGNFQKEDGTEIDLLLKYYEQYIESIKKSNLWKNIEILNKSGEKREKVLDSESYEGVLARNKNNMYYNVPEYLVYLIFEVINSAIKHGKKNGQNPMPIMIYKDEQFLCVKNYVDEKFTMRSIIEGLKRKKGGISLATLCEYFIRAYDDRYVKIDYNKEEQTIVIGLPIYER